MSEIPTPRPKTQELPNQVARYQAVSRERVNSVTRIPELRNSPLVAESQTPNVRDSSSWSSRRHDRRAVLVHPNIEPFPVHPCRVLDAPKQHDASTPPPSVTATLTAFVNPSPFPTPNGARSPSSYPAKRCDTGSNTDTFPATSSAHTMI